MQKPELPEIVNRIKLKWYHPLIIKDRKDFLLSIDQQNIKTPKDTIIDNNRYKSILLLLKLINKSNDTLKYINMDCSRWEIYRTSTKELVIPQCVCEHNVPNIITIAPQKSLIVNLSLVYENKTISKNLVLKIGMSLQKYVRLEQLLDFDAYTYLSRPEASNLIRSNEIKVP